LRQADEAKIRRYAPIEFIGSFSVFVFRYGIADKSMKRRPPTPPKVMLWASFLPGYAHSKTASVNAYTPAGVLACGMTILNISPELNQ
jgi:hypothetical protein